MDYLVRHLPLVRILTVAWVLGGCVYGGKILVLHPMFAPSHVLAIRTLTQKMVERGHEVVVVRFDPNIAMEVHPNTTEVVLQIDNSDGRIPFMTLEKSARFEMPLDTWENGGKFNFLPASGCLTVVAFCHTLLGDSQFLSRLKNEHFDVVLVDLIYNECSMALAHHLDVPAVGYWAFTFVGYEPLYTAAFNPPSTVPYIFSGLAGHMAFTDRLWNYFLHFYSVIFMEFQFLVAQHTIIQYLPNSPSPATLLANLSGVIINSHPVLDRPRQLPPAFVEVGGFHIKEQEPLPKHLEQFMASAGPEGVILFSLGCTFNTDMLPSFVVNNFLKAFAKLPYKVLIRVAGSLPHVPSNVLAVHWLPQVDVLADPRTVLFVTHCGMHGVLEAIHHTVPMVGIPIFGDQRDVFLRLQEWGAVLGVDKDAPARELRAAMMEAITNVTYRHNVETLSRVLKDYQPSPLQSAVWLLEHVMLTRGAHHLKTHTQHLNTLQYLGVDVAALYLFLMGATLYATYRLVVNVDRYIPYKRKVH